MSCGIYMLTIYSDIERYIYIGSSVDIRARFKRHMYELRRFSHANYKVQDAYDSYNNISLEIIQECSPEELYPLEAFWLEQARLERFVVLNLAQIGRAHV